MHNIWYGKLCSILGATSVHYYCCLWAIAMDSTHKHLSFTLENMSKAWKHVVPMNLNLRDRLVVVSTILIYTSRWWLARYPTHCALPCNHTSDPWPAILPTLLTCRKSYQTITNSSMPCSVGLTFRPIHNNISFLQI